MGWRWWQIWLPNNTYLKCKTLVLEGSKLPLMPCCSNSIMSCSFFSESSSIVLFISWVLVFVASSEHFSSADCEMTDKMHTQYWNSASNTEVITWEWPITNKVSKFVKDKKKSNRNKLLLKSHNIYLLYMHTPHTVCWSSKMSKTKIQNAKYVT